MIVINIWTDEDTGEDSTMETKVCSSEDEALVDYYQCAGRGFDYKETLIVCRDDHIIKTINILDYLEDDIIHREVCHKELMSWDK